MTAGSSGASTSTAPYRSAGHWPRCGHGQNGAVPRFEPFRALRYAPSVDLDAVIAPPYDVLSDADVDALEARDARNIVHVDVPRGGADRYDAGRATCCGRGSPTARWSATTSRRSRSTACASPTPPARARDLVGVLGGLEVVDEGAGGVLPHERTTPKASTDRLDLTRATDANLSPVWGLSLASRSHRAAAPSRASRSARSPSTASSTSSSGSPTRPRRRHPRAPRPRRRADRRRPPPLRRRPGLPRRGPGGDRSRPTRRPSRRWRSSASSSPSSSASRRSTGSTRASRSPTCAPPSPRASTSRRPTRPTPATLADDGRPRAGWCSSARTAPSG